MVRSPSVFGWLRTFYLSIYMKKRGKFFCNHRQIMGSPFKNMYERKKIMKLLKQMMGVVLAVLLFGGFTVNAQKTPQQLACEELVSLGILAGDEEGNLLLEKTVTRAEMAVIVCRLLALEDAAVKNTVTTPVFSDVSASHWAAGYLDILKNYGIINGYPDGTFCPEQEVSYQEVLKMLIALLGYLPKADSIGAYPHGVLMIANQLGITADLVIPTRNPAVRSDVALLISRILDIPFMMQVTYGADAEYQIMENCTIRNTYFETK